MSCIPSLQSCGQNTIFCRSPKNRAVTIVCLALVAIAMTVARYQGHLRVTKTVIILAYSVIGLLILSTLCMAPQKKPTSQTNQQNNNESVIPGKIKVSTADDNFLIASVDPTKTCVIVMPGDQPNTEKQLTVDLKSLSLNQTKVSEIKQAIAEHLGRKAEEIKLMYGLITIKDTDNLRTHLTLEKVKVLQLSFV